MIRVRGRRPTIPEYFQEYIDSSIDLLSTPSICCPFHEEDSPSFKYSHEKGICTCFGGCHKTWDLIGLHQKKCNLSSRKAAEKSLDELYEVRHSVEDVGSIELSVRDEVVEEESIYQEALIWANTPDRWLEMDYVMQQYPPNMENLQALVNKWKGVNYESRTSMAE